MSVKDSAREAELAAFERDAMINRRQTMGSLIAEYRRQRRMSEIDFAEALGVELTAVARIEAGMVELTYEQVRQIEKTLGISHSRLGLDSGYFR